MRWNWYIGVIVGCLAASSASAQLRIVNYNVAGLNGDTNAMRDVFAALNDDDKPGFAVAPALYVFQEVHSSDVAALGNLLNQASPPGISYTQGTYTSFCPGIGTDASGAQAMFYRADLLTEDVSGHLDIFTGASRCSDRWKLDLVGYDSPDASFYIYSSHLKASTGGSNEQVRLTGAMAIRDNADALGPGKHIIYAGDMNVYNAAEPAYLEFLSSGTGQALDPLGTGTWSGSNNAIKHTQAPCNGTCSLVGGGMDDRFDLQLSTGAFQDGSGLSLMSGVYRSLGNDGLHYDQSINTGNNSYYPSDIPRSNALADDLFVASDHIPVVGEYQVPAVLTAELVSDVGRVIQGAAVSVEAEISNDAVVVVANGADALDYTAAGDGAVTGMVSGSVAALAGPAVVELDVDTSVVGVVSGSIAITSTSQAAQNAPASLPVSGEVVRPANASFSSGSDESATVVAVELDVDSGVQTIEVPVYNRGFDENQALLDVDSVDGLGGLFGLCGSLPTGVELGGGVVCLTFDTTGLSTGDYGTSVTINTSDEDIPGEGQGALFLTIEIELGQPSVPEASRWGQGLGLVLVLSAGWLAMGRSGRTAL